MDATKPMAQQEEEAIAAQMGQQKIEAAAAERKRQGEPADPVYGEDPGAPELVR